MATLPTSLSLAVIADGSLINAADHRNNYAAVQTEANALLTILGGGTSAQFLQSGGGTTVSWAGAYSAYTPTWAASGAAPAIGNATVVARYLQIGKLVHAYGNITFGNTSTFGTGSYTFALPVTSTAAFTRNIGTAELADNSTTNYMLANALLTSATTVQFQYGSTYGGPAALAGQTVPWTWAQSDIIGWNFMYEAA